MSFAAWSTLSVHARDKGKVLKYANTSDSGSLQDHVTNLIENDSGRAASMRPFKINGD